MASSYSKEIPIRASVNYTITVPSDVDEPRWAATESTRSSRIILSFSQNLWRRLLLTLTFKYSDYNSIGSTDHISCKLVCLRLGNAKLKKKLFFPLGLPVTKQTLLSRYEYTIFKLVYSFMLIVSVTSPFAYSMLLLVRVFDTINQSVSYSVGAGSFSTIAISFLIKRLNYECICYQNSST